MTINPLTLRALAERAERVPGELDRELRARVRAVMAKAEGRFAYWTGYRGRSDQEKAKARGHSRASFGQSPHNYKPGAFAVDLVLDPRRVDVRPHPSNPRFPDLWDNASPEAVEAWAHLEELALENHLERVDLPGTGRDRPHLELPDWRRLRQLPNGRS